MPETTNPLLSLSPSELRAFLAQANALVKDADQQRREEYGDLGTDFLGHVVETSPLTYSPTSDWAGYSDYGIPFEHKGRQYTATVRITDTELKDARKEGTAAQTEAEPAKYYTPKKRKAA
jgi:hypothetical protein